jgi:hypothetical protein
MAGKSPPPRRRSDVAGKSRAEKGIATHVPTKVVPMTDELGEEMRRHVAGPGRASGPLHPQGRGAINYYSTQPLLAWLLNHHFFGGLHFTWAAHPFYPYKQPNPKSSNPYAIYADFFSPWYDDDAYDRNIVSMRQSLRNGILAHKKTLHPSTQRFLKRVCEEGSVLLFYPVVYRLDLTSIDLSRVDSLSGSAAVGSHEVLIRDLRETEFDILFFEDHRHPTLRQLTNTNSDRTDIVRILRRECLL